MGSSDLVRQSRWYESQSAIFGGLVVALITGCGLAYTIGKDVGQGDLSSYKAVNEMGVAEIVSELSVTAAEVRAATSEFKTMLVENATYEEMRNQFDSLKMELEASKILNSELNATVKASEDKIRELSDRLTSITDPDLEYVIYENSSESLFGGVIHVGLLELGVDGVAKVKIDGTSHTVTVGDVIPQDASKNCSLTVLETDYVSGSLKFSTNCGLQ